MNTRKHKSIRPTPGMKRIQNYLFKFVDFLGKGNFSSVYKGINQFTKQIVAIKYIALSSLTCERLRQLLDQQIEILTSVNHPNIVKCFEVLKSAHNCYIITELCDGGDLEGLLKKKTRFTQDQAIPYIKDIFQGLYYLAKKNIIHRDIKLANIFLNKGKAKIADFGFAQKSKTEFNDGKIGTPLCMSPEGFLQNLYGSKTDVWAFGIIMFQMTHGRLHLDHCTSQQQLREQIQIQLKYSQLRQDLSHELRELIVRCLDVNPCTRITFQQIRKHPFIERITQNRMETFSMQDLKYIPSCHRNSTSSEGEQYIVSLKSLENPQFNHLPVNEKIQVSQQNEHLNFQYGTKRICENLPHQRQEQKQNIPSRPPKIQVNKISYIPNRKIETTKNIQCMSPTIIEDPFEQNRMQSRSFSTLPEQSNNDASLRKTADNLLQVPRSPMTAPFRKHKGSFEMSPTQQQKVMQKNLRTTVSTRASLDETLNTRLLEVQKYTNQSLPVQIDPLTNTRRLLTGFMKFNQAIGVIHYCRLFYKYIIELKRTGIYHEGDLNLRYYSSYLLNLLNELDSKIATDQIVLTKGNGDQENKQRKLDKMHKVIQEYIERYKPNLERQRSDYLNRNIGQIKHIITLDQKFIQTFYIIDKRKIQSYNEKLIRFTDLLEKNSRYQKYIDFDSNNQLQEATKQQKKPITGILVERNQTNKLPEPKPFKKHSNEMVHLQTCSHSQRA